MQTYSNMALNGINNFLFYFEKGIGAPALIVSSNHLFNYDMAGRWRNACDGILAAHHEVRTKFHANDTIDPYPADAKS
jgi:hypothetical protein